MDNAVYVLCAATSILCAVLLLRAYFRSGFRLLLWSGLCFVGLTVNNLLLFIDKIVMPDEAGLFGIEFQLSRAICAFAAMAVLVFGLIWDSE